MSSQRRNIIIAVSVAILLVVGLVLLSAVISPSGNPGPAVSGSSTPGTATTYDENSLGVTSTTGTEPSPTATAVQWEELEAIDSAVASPSVAVYLGESFAYNVTAVAAGNCSSGSQATIQVDVHSIGSQQVAGNWTTGYTMTYDGIQTLDISVLFTAPSSYQVTAVNVTSLPNQTRQITYDSAQQALISYDLSSQAFRDNQTLQSAMNGGSFYVESVSPVNSTNSNTSLIYHVMLREIGGRQAVSIWTNGNPSSIESIGAVGEYNGGQVPVDVGQTLYCPAAGTSTISASTSTLIG